MFLLQPVQNCLREKNSDSSPVQPVDRRVTRATLYDAQRRDRALNRWAFLQGRTELPDVKKNRTKQ